MGASCGLDVVAAAALVNMYDKCGNLVDARRVFDNANMRDLVLWNTMISAYAQNGKSKEAIELFESMQAEGLQPDNITFSNIFAVCADTAEQVEGEWLHAYIMASGLELESIVGNSLIHMYAHCDELDHAEHVFKNLHSQDVVSWTVMIAAYILHEQYEKCFQAFDQMQLEGVLPDKVTFLSMLSICHSGDSCFDHKHITARIFRSDFQSEVAIHNACINLCNNKGDLQDAEQIFNTMSKRDIVSWNAMITAYAHQGKPELAIGVFSEMLKQNVMANKVTFVNLLSVCIRDSLLAEGTYLYAWAVENGYEIDITLGTTVIMLCGKSGSLEDAQCYFQYMPERNIFMWNAMMAVYAQHGQETKAIEHFWKMQEEEMLPDNLSFLAVLAACSHAGLADDSQIFFLTMVENHGILPSSDHYACIVDSFGRAGRLDEAEAFALSIPSHPTGASFNCVLSACRPSLDTLRGERVVRYSSEIDFDNTIQTVILSCMYAALENSGDDETVFN